MDLYDGLDLLDSLPRRLARLAAFILAAALMVGMVAWRQQTTNLLYGQAIARVVTAASQITGVFGIECHRQQNGVFGEVRLECRHPTVGD